MWDAFVQTLLQFLSLSWWFWVFLILFPLWKSTWLFWRQQVYKHSNDCRMVLLEIHIPREVRKNPQGMEQVLMSIQQLRNAPADLRERWWDGEVTRWFSFEIASFGGEVHFYVRTYYKQRLLVESAFFAFYPDLEINEVEEDYVNRFPKNITELKQKDYEAWGSEMQLVREYAYPIRTYREFEAPEEEKQYDPISNFVEMLAKVRKEEVVGIQILAAPAPPEWRDKYKDLVNRLRTAEDKKVTAPGAFTTTAFPGGPLPAFGVKGEKETQQFPSRMFLMRTPGETDVLEAVENNLAKPAFNVLIRFIYLSPKDLFYDSFARRGLVGSFNQYGNLSLNYFVQNYAVSTRTKFWQWPHILPITRNNYRKQRLLYNYRHRIIPHETFIGKLITSYIFSWNFWSHWIIMNTECLATIFHPPTFIVLTGPHIKRIESRKAGPPAGLAIYGEEESLDKFK